MYAKGSYIVLLHEYTDDKITSRVDKEDNTEEILQKRVENPN